MRNGKILSLLLALAVMGCGKFTPLAPLTANLAPATVAPVDCVGTFTSCTKTCGGGTQTFNISVPGAGAGLACPFAQGFVQACNLQACPMAQIIAPVNCVGAFSSCSATCGGGIQTFNVSQVASGGGTSCAYAPGYQQSCNTQTCGLPAPIVIQPSAPVCDPFVTGSASATNQGLVADLHFLSTVQYQSPFGDVESYINKADFVVPNAVYFHNLNIPTEWFTQGFSDSNGNTLKDNNGNNLIQYFGMRIKGNMVLGNWLPGQYQIAVLSDDGSIITISGGVKNSDGSRSDLVINNDGNHSTKMGCTSQILTMDANSSFPITIDYYQGPPVSIALVLMARPVPTGNTSDSLCGQSGDSLFFNDSNHPAPSIPQAPYSQLLTDSWTVIDSSHFVLPSNGINPCTPQALTLTTSFRQTNPTTIIPGTATITQPSGYVTVPNSITIPNADIGSLGSIYNPSTLGWLTLQVGNETTYCYARAVGASSFSLIKQKAGGGSTDCNSLVSDLSTLNPISHIVANDQITYSLNSYLQPSSTMPLCTGVGGLIQGGSGCQSLLNTTFASTLTLSIVYY